MAQIFYDNDADLSLIQARKVGIIDLTGRWDNGSLRISGAYYDYRIANLVERYLAGTGSFFFRNRGAARLRGAEVEALRAEAAEALGMSESTAKRAWAYARAWLYEELKGP